MKINVLPMYEQITEESAKDGDVFGRGYLIGLTHTSRDPEYHPVHMNNLKGITKARQNAIRAYTDIKSVMYYLRCFGPFEAELTHGNKIYLKQLDPEKKDQKSWEYWQFYLEFESAQDCQTFAMKLQEQDWVHWV